MGRLVRTTKRVNWIQRLSFPVVAMLALGMFASAAAFVNAQTATTEPETLFATSTPTTSTPIATSTGERAEPEQQPAVPTTARSLTPEEQQRVINLAANISNQLEATLRRYEMIVSRLETRTSLVENAGGDTTIARQYLTQLQGDVATGETQLQQIDQRVSAMATAANPAAAWQPIKLTYRNTADVLLAARTNAIATIAALKAATL